MEGIIGKCERYCSVLSEKKKKVSFYTNIYFIQQILACCFCGINIVYVYMFRSLYLSS